MLYKIVVMAGDDVQEQVWNSLEEAVNEYLAKGWEVAGGVSVVVFGPQDAPLFQYSQALVYPDRLLLAEPRVAQLSSEDPVHA